MASLTLHRVNELIDDGEFFARSQPVAIPPGINANRGGPFLAQAEARKAFHALDLQNFLPVCIVR
jgi:hypothetical protein